MVKVNLACGDRYHQDWINLDFISKSKYVRKYNLLNKLPFEDASVDIVYSSHFLEHLSPVQAKRFLTECHRILKTDGIMRIVVPDLENITSEYLFRLNIALSDNKKGNDLLKYELVKLELFDQMVRNRPGGELLEFYKKNMGSEEIEKYVKMRTGENLDAYNLKKRTLFQRLKLIHKNSINQFILNFYLKVVELMIPKSLRDLLFVKTTIGERHLWMYDRLSIVMLLESIGFRSVDVLDHKTSNIPDFECYGLDINQDGSPYKGSGSLYCEAVK